MLSHGQGTCPIPPRPTHRAPGTAWEFLLYLIHQQCYLDLVTVFCCCWIQDKCEFNIILDFGDLDRNQWYWCDVFLFGTRIIITAIDDMGFGSQYEACMPLFLCSLTRDKHCPQEKLASQWVPPCWHHGVLLPRTSGEGCRLWNLSSVWVAVTKTVCFKCMKWFSW
jgi:hypothetical protein